MLTTEFLKSLKLSNAEKVLLAQTYNGNYSFLHFKTRLICV